MWLLEDVSRVTNHDSNIPAKTLSLSVHSACSIEGMSFACHFNSLKSASANPREVSVGRRPLPNGWDCTAPHVIQQMKEVPTQHLPYLVSVHRIFLLQLTLSHCLVLSLIFLQFFCWHHGSGLADCHQIGQKVLLVQLAENMCVVSHHDGDLFHHPAVSSGSASLSLGTALCQLFTPT